MKFIGVTAAIAVLVGLGPTVSGMVIADSFNDWIAATNDGIGAGGGPVTPGSAADAPQQGHTDASGSGTWTYGYGSSGDGSAFGGGFPLFNQWTGSSWVVAGLANGSVSATSHGPRGSSLTTDPMAYRRWVSDGDFAGETLSAIAEFTIPDRTGAPGYDGFTIIFSVSASGVDNTISVVPGQSGTFTRVIEFTDTPSAYVLVGIRPEGVGPKNLNDFFFDAFDVELTIVPEPASLALLLPVGLVALRRR